MKNIQAAITAVHGSVPEKILSNADLEKMVDTNDEWSERVWFCGEDLTYSNFWGAIEKFVEEHNPLLPF